MKPERKYSHVFWDWNGTLFDDLNWCIGVLNSMLSKRGMKNVGSIADYHSVFCFPVIDYYRNVGFDFDKEPFEVLAAEFMELYYSENSGNCELFPGTQRILAEVRQLEIKQVILSASKTSILEAQISRFDILGYFDELLGLSDIYASSKIDIGFNYITREHVERAVLIGDSKHDYEVAVALGIDCLLIPNGHQSRETLLSCGVPVLDNISDVPRYL